MASSLDSGLISLLTIARIHGLTPDPAEMIHEFAGADKNFDDIALLRAANWIGLRAKRTKSSFKRLSTTPMPFIAALKNGQYLLIAGVRGETLLVQRAEAAQPATIDRAQFERDWSGRVILATKRAAPTGAARAFDFSWFIPFVLKYRVYFVDVMLASFFLQLFALVTPLFFQVIIDKVLVHRGLSTLDILALGLLLVSVFEVVLGGVRNYVLAHTTNRIDVALGAELFNHLLRLPIAYFEMRRVGDTVARARELETVRNFITGSSITVVIDTLFTALFLMVMYWYSPRLCAAVAVTLPLYALLAIAVTPTLRARLNHKFSRGADNQAFLVEVVTGIETLKAAAVEPATRQRWEERLAAYVAASFSTSSLSNIANQLASLINKLMVLAILWLGARAVIEGTLTVGQLVAFNMLAGRIAGPIIRLVQLWQDFQQAGISVQRLGDILNAVPETSPHTRRRSLPKLRGNVALERVTFRYQPDGPPALSDFSLVARAGTIVGIVGRSGSGKSTLGKLIQRLYVPERGRVLVDGVDLAEVDTAWLRRSIGVVLQDNVLFNRSVRDNIALADPATPFADIVAAAELSGAHEFVRGLPQGYDTMVHEQGANFSGGQRQRIAIARALITNPRILIFDEATSALDYESEALIQDNMQAICADRTVFIIAHRLSAVHVADTLVVVDGGRVVQSGSPRELLAVDGYYARLVRQQRNSGGAAQVL